MKTSQLIDFYDDDDWGERENANENYEVIVPC